MKNNIMKIDSETIANLFEQINEEVNEYLEQNETKINTENSITAIIEEIAKRSIREILIEINNKFIQFDEKEQEKHITFNLRSVEKAMVQKMKCKPLNKSP